MNSPLQRAIVGLIGTLAMCSAGSAQNEQRTNPAEAAVQTGADRPITAVETADPELLALAKLLAGSFAATESGTSPALRFNAAAIQVSGLDNATYFEVTRADSPSEAVQQGVLHLFRTKSGIRLRMFGFAGTQGAPLVGLWAVPESMPALEGKGLYPVMDLTLKGAPGGTYVGATECAYPTSRDGAVEARSRVTISDDGLVFEDEGFGASGERVWGASGAEAPKFKRSLSSVKGAKAENGLVVITMNPPTEGSEPLAESGEVVVQYTGWLTDGREFDSSRRPGREPFKLRIPGGVIKGWNEGLKGISKGERRRLLIPSELAYGARGRPPVIPPNSTLVFDVECLFVNNQPSPAPQSSMVPASPETPPTAVPPLRPQPAAPGAAPAAPASPVSAPK